MTWMSPKSIPPCQEEKNWQKKHNPNPLSLCHCKPRSKKHLSFFPPFHPFSSKSKWPFQSWHAGSRPTWPFQAQQWSSQEAKSSWRPSRRNTLPRLRPFHQKIVLDFLPVDIWILVKYGGPGNELFSRWKTKNFGNLFITVSNSQTSYWVESMNCTETCWL